MKETIQSKINQSVISKYFATYNVVTDGEFTLRFLTPYTRRCIDISQDSQYLCRGARDMQLTVLYRMGLISAPTDEAFTATSNRVLGKDQK